MISNVIRFATEKLTSVENDLLSYQYGIVSSVVNASATYIPNPFNTISGLIVTPRKVGTTTANGVALFTTTVGYEVDTLSAVVNDLPAWGTTTAYYAGAIVKNNNKAYICVEDHTSGSSFDNTKFVELTATKFIKITHSAAGSGKIVSLFYQLNGLY